MNRLAILAFALSVAVSTAWADVPLPSDLKYIDPRMRFDGVEEHKDYVFHLRFLTFSGGPANTPYRLIEVKDAKPFDLKSQRRLTGMALLAMERKEFDKRAKDDPSLKWLTDKTEGVLKASINAPSTVGSVKDKEVPVTEYKTSIKDGKLSAELQKKEKPRSEAAPDGRLPQLAFGVFSALSLAVLGIWFVRRRVPSVTATA